MKIIDGHIASKRVENNTVVVIESGNHRKGLGYWKNLRRSSMMSHIAKANDMAVLSISKNNHLHLNLFPPKQRPKTSYGVSIQ
ncbi:MAG: hypothetical protein ABSG90_09910 [Dehalococcoidia bacterium]|jgi:hypothetical protein